MYASRRRERRPSQSGFLPSWTRAAAFVSASVPDRAGRERTLMASIAYSTAVVVSGSSAGRGRTLEQPALRREGGDALVVHGSSRGEHAGWI